MNEFGKEKKEYRRCRENLFVHLLNQGKYEEALPLFIEICKFYMHACTFVSVKKP